MNDEHRTAARAALRALILAIKPPENATPEGTVNLWLSLIGPRLDSPDGYAQLVKAYLEDTRTYDPRYGQRWPVPAALLSYLAQPPVLACRDLVAEFNWLANLSRIRAHCRWDPVECRMVEVSADDQARAKLVQRYGEELPPEINGGLREVGGLRGLRLRLRTDRDVPFVLRAFVAAGKAALEQAQLPAITGQRPAQLTVAAVGNVIPLRRRES